MANQVVVDTSLVVKWLIEESDSDKANQLARLWVRNNVEPVAPYLLPIEVANVLYQRVRRSQLSSEFAGLRMDDFFDYGLQFIQPVGLHRRAIELATQSQQGAAYDAHCLALAELLGCEYWTADERFYNAVSPAYPQVRLLSTFTG